MRLVWFGLLIAATCGLGAVWAPSDRAWRFLGAFVRGNSRAGLQRKDTAAYMGIKDTLLSRQLALRDGAHPSLARAGELPDEVWIEFADQLCAEVGGARVVKDEKMDHLLRTLGDIDIRMAHIDGIRKVG